MEIDRKKMTDMITTIQDRYINNDTNTISNADLQITNYQIIDLFELYLDGVIFGRKN